MSRRLQSPNTKTDLVLHDLLDKAKSFVVTAGAGSGKTTSLVKALRYIEKTHGKKLRINRQKVACITYTIGAEKEILRDVNEDPLFHVSTIHSFLWTISKTFQADIKKWVAEKIDNKIAELQRDKAGFGPRVQQKTRDKNLADIERYTAIKSILYKVKKFNYGVSSNYAEGLLGHDDVLNLGPELIDKYPLMQKLVAQQFPFILVDESQDTFPQVVSSFKVIQKNCPRHFCLGFFGDPMQQIYLSGIGKIGLEENWSQVDKPENYRCSSSVLSVINRIRASGDMLQQVPRPQQPIGTARIFVMPANENRDEKLIKIRTWISLNDKDNLWISETPGEEFRMLVLVHRMAAKRLNFAKLYEALNDDAPDSFKAGFLDGSLWVLRPLLTFALPIVEAHSSEDQGKVISLLRQLSPVLSEEKFNAAKKPAEDLLKIKKSIEALSKTMENTSKATVRDVYKLMLEHQLFDLDERILDNLDLLEKDISEETSEITASFIRFCDCSVADLWGYQKYLKEESAFSTQHGVKGAEFQRVLVVLDDEEAKYNLYSYERYFGLQPLSETDLKRQAEGKENVVDRTRRLFYVCCSRAQNHLAVVIFVKEPLRAVEIIKKTAFFAEDQIFLESNLKQL